MDLALALYEQGEWDGVLYFTGCALAITYRPRSYICEAASWGSLPHDLRSIALFHTGRLKEAQVRRRGRLWSWSQTTSGSREISSCWRTVRKKAGNKRAPSNGWGPLVF